MKENKYDDNIFFQKYSQMSRSQQGLAGAGEWETLRKLLPDFCVLIWDLATVKSSVSLMNFV